MLTITELNQLEKCLNKNLIQIISGLRQALTDQKTGHYDPADSAVPFTKQLLTDNLLNTDASVCYRLGYQYADVNELNDRRKMILDAYADYLALIHFGRNVSWETNQMQEPFFNVRLIARSARQVQPITMVERGFFESSYDSAYTDLLIRREINTSDQIESLIDGLTGQVAVAA